MNVKAILRHGIAVFAALAVASPAIAEIDLEDMEGRVGKSTAEASVVFDKPKGTCVCLTNTTAAVVGMAGLLRQARVTVGGVTRVRVDCRVVGFSPTTGELLVQQDCSNFATLPK